MRLLSQVSIAKNHSIGKAANKMHSGCLLVRNTPFVLPFFLKNSYTTWCKKGKHNKSEECPAPNICIHHGLWNEDTWWSDGKEGGGQDRRAVQQLPIPDEGGAAVALVLLFWPFPLCLWPPLLLPPPPDFGCKKKGWGGS